MQASSNPRGYVDSSGRYRSYSRDRLPRDKSGERPPSRQEQYSRQPSRDSSRSTRGLLAREPRFKNDTELRHPSPAGETGQVSQVHGHKSVRIFDSPAFQAEINEKIYNKNKLEFEPEDSAELNSFTANLGHIRTE
jgi:hypothetical protein